MKAYAVIQGPRRAVLALAKDSWWAKYLAACELDHDAICGLTGSIHNVNRVLREHKAKVIKVDFVLPPTP